MRRAGTRALAEAGGQYQVLSGHDGQPQVADALDDVDFGGRAELPAVLLQELKALGAEIHEEPQKMWDDVVNEDLGAGGAAKQGQRGHWGVGCSSGGALQCRTGGGALRKRGGGQGCIGRGGEVPIPPLQGAQPMPSHCLPDGKCQLQWRFVTDSIRPPTALATFSNRLSNRFWNRL